MTGVWQTAVQYHAWHSLALFALGLLLLHWPERWGLGLAGWLFVAGSCCSRAACTPWR
jgi:uncharacterized membrane protein YgdD (TMEM256/DUF423 family)